MCPDGGCMGRDVEYVKPGSFDPVNHFYPRVLNAQMHPIVRSFFRLGNDRIAQRFCHLHPEVDAACVADVLHRSTRLFQWGGSDLFITTSGSGQKRLVVVEMNSCPSGQKSMPLYKEDCEQGGYRTLLEKSFMPTLRGRSASLPSGHLAVLYDKNQMEAWGYAAALADLSSETVLLVPCRPDDCSKHNIRFSSDDVLEVQLGRSRPSSDWQPVRAALRYVTQHPWSRIPPFTRTFIYNPVVVCLAGGRNKMLAARAYDVFNTEIAHTGLRIFTPQTIWDVSKFEVPSLVRRMDGMAVVKVPYTNAGQGVWTIARPSELQEFMETDHRYDRFIVQALIGNSGWSARRRRGSLYHAGTVPDSKGNIYAEDLRFLVGSSPDGKGFFPVAIYARRARVPLAEFLCDGAQSWDMLGTNLSFKNGDGSWGTDPERLLLMDNRDFNLVGIGMDDLIEAYMQTVLAMLAIDNLAVKLMTQQAKLDIKLFSSLNPDEKLLGELYYKGKQTDHLNGLQVNGGAEHNFGKICISNGWHTAAMNNDGLEEQDNLEMAVCATTL